MQAITVAMIIYVAVCAALVFVVSVFEDIKRRRELHPRDKDSVKPAGGSDLNLESRDIEPPHNAPRTRHAA
jgi:hypothetical protein